MSINWRRVTELFTRPSRSYEPAPPREPTVPNVLRYPAQPEPDPEPNPLAALNRRWKYTSMATAASRLQEPPKPFRLRERPMKLPAATGGAYMEEPTPRRENEPPRNPFAAPVVAAKAYQAEPESPVEKLPRPLRGPFETEAWTSASWQDCTRSVKNPETLSGFGWATPEQKDWIQELKQQLIDRGEAECREGAAEWAHAEYQETFGELDALVWNAARTGMSMFDFISMMQWERENGCGSGLFNSYGDFEYRSGPGFL